MTILSYILMVIIKKYIFLIQMLIEKTHYIIEHGFYKKQVVNIKLNLHQMKIENVKAILLV